MSTPSPGPGWWLASDGKWYPRQWEYSYFTTEAHAQRNNAMHEAMEIVDSRGQRAWEMVNFAYHESDPDRHWTVQVFMKRPLAR
jgi:hypothetical protein